MQNQSWYPEDSKNSEKKIFYGYIIVGASVAVQLISIGAFFTYGIFFKHFLNEFGWSRAVISGASSITTLFAGLMGIFAGRLSDRFGPRTIMAVSGLFLGGGYLLMSLLQAPWQLYLFYGVIVGTGMASHDIVTLSTVARWFVRKRGMMTGVVKVGTGAGQLIVPLIAMALIAACDWRNTYLIIGATALILFVLVAQLFRRDPQQMGLLPDGADRTVSAVSGAGEQGLSLREVLRTRQFWLVSLTYFSAIYCLITIVVHIVPHATDVGISETSAAGVLSAIGGVSMAGRFTIGTISDRIGCKRAWIICFIILIASFIWLQMTRELWMFYLFAVIYGFAHGGLFVLASPTAAELFGTRAHGVIFGTIGFAGTLGGSVGPFLAGYLFDITQSYQIAFWILIVLGVNGLALISTVKPISVNKKS
jgi:MFS family permease